MKKTLKNLIIYILIISLLIPGLVVAEDKKEGLEADAEELFLGLELIDPDADLEIEEISNQVAEILLNTPDEELNTGELKAKRKLEYKINFDKQVEKASKKSLEELTTSYLLGDFETGKILIENNIDEMVAIASTSKILSIFVVLDEISKGNISMDDMIEIDRQISFIRGSSYELKEGEKKSVRELIAAALVVSGNDATSALAKHVAGSEENFVKLMERKLLDLGIVKFEIINCSGLPNYNIDKQNMMTTRGLFELSREFIKAYPEMLEITQMKMIEEKERDFKGKNTNPILGELEEIDGLKTGYTGLAGRCMVATGEKTVDGLPFRLIGISMGSNSDPDRYVAIKRIMEEAFKSYKKVELGYTDSSLETLELEEGTPRNLDIYQSNTIELMIKTDDVIKSDIEYYPIVPPLEKGSKVGKVNYYINGEEVYETDLIIDEDWEIDNFINRLLRFTNDLYKNAYEFFNH